MKRIIEPYYVLNWDDNKHTVENYNIMPYLIDEWKALKPKQRRETLMDFDKVKDFILKKSMYQFWARCQYEIIISDWPCLKYKEKIDIYRQIEMNIDIIVNHFLNQIHNGKRVRK